MHIQSIPHLHDQLRFLSGFRSPLKALVCVNDIPYNISIVMLFSCWLSLKKKKKI